MNPAKVILSASIFAVVMLISVQSLFACECRAPARHNIAISDEFEKAETVIAATVVSEPDLAILFDQQYVKVQVEKVYKGKAKVSETLTFGQSAGKDCLWYFSKANVGNRYLFYLTKPTKARPYKTNEVIERSNAAAKYYVSTCGRSAEIEKAIDDISYLEQRLSTGSILVPGFAVLQLQPLVLCKQRSDLGI